jgi:hypothetical protein
VLEDELSPYLDFATVQPIHWSNQFQMRISNGTLYADFDPIYLPNAEDNLLDAQGFLRFRVHQIPDLPSGTIIENSVNITLDSELTYTTNVVSNRISGFAGIKEQLPVVFDLYPNPIQDMMYWSNDEMHLKRIMNTTGSSWNVVTKKGANSYSTQGLQAGFYICEFENDQGELYYVRILKL